jgi:polar amino acid transport system substrate-binding protein
MRQLTQKLKDGKMKILEVPIPMMQKGEILIQNYYSLISAGTEISTIKAARKGYIGKAKDRPQQAKKVIDTIKNQGITQTYRAVMKKLDAYSPLGYSSVGKVIDIGHKVQGFKTGDYVTCGGLSASHAEIISVPENLCVKLQPETDLKHAAYNTLGAIAMQGLRQADLRLGESCAVIGLGLIGQLTALLLKASGVRVLGIDIDPAVVQVAEKHCVDLALHRDQAGIEDKILQFTYGLGCDAVITTAASSSTDPINFAGAISRKKGTIVVVGAVPTGFEREPHFYKKELQVKMSCSYGPGRYDASYEEKGIDYPAAYVRWTENRNMQAFQQLIYSKKIDLSYLTTHTFKLKDALAAYEMMMTKSEPYIGILIEYDASKELKKEKIVLKAHGTGHKAQGITVGFIGAGSYAQSHLLPNLPKKDVTLKGVMTSSGTSSRSVAERFGFEFCTSDERDILENDEINTIFIATRHDSHAEYVIKALKAGKHVFVEKPLCITIEELEEIKKCYEQAAMSNQLLMVGYNRRFSPLTNTAKEQFSDGPMAMIYRINAGDIPADSWIHDDAKGGGRIIGEICHFVDFLTYMNGSSPVSVYAAAMKDPNNLNDTLNIILSYKNGSIGTISYFSNGDNSLPKEHVEIFSNGWIVVIKDFKAVSIYAKRHKSEKKLMHQDKGQKSEIKQFIKGISEGAVNMIPFNEIYSNSFVTLKIVESIRTGNCLEFKL